MTDTHPSDVKSPAARIAERASAELSRLGGEPLRPGLYLVATPIGNLADITLRALSVLSRADVIYCEDTRHSLTLVTHYGIGTRLKPYHEHNAEAERPRILAALADGRRVALISDAGTPLISDPGYKLVRDVIGAGHPVESIPGPSAALTALTVAGLPTDAFHFAGFLPPRSAARRTRLAELGRIGATLVVYEAPSRMADTLADMADVLGPRPAAVARELTKRFETIERGSLSDLASKYASEEHPRGEFVILIGAPVAGEVSDADITAALTHALQSMTLRDAAKAVSAALGIPKSRAYDLGLKLK